MKLKLRPSVVAVMFVLSATAAWAADPSSNSEPKSRTSNAAPSGTENAATDSNVWKYVNGQKSAGSTGGPEQSVNSESSSGNDRSARAEDSNGNDQAAMSEDSSEGNSPAMKDEQEDQVAAEESGDDMMAMATPGSSTQTFQPATLADFTAATQDKLVVILPSGWQGSVPQLLAALEQNANASEVLILSHDAQADADDEDDDDE